MAAAQDYRKEATEWEERVRIVRRHYEGKGYRVHSGLQFGCELVLYADDPSRVHSDFCVHVLPEGGRLDWRTIQSLVRSMADLHKTLLLANLCPDDSCPDALRVEEIALTTEHAPFRHKHAERLQQASQVGAQRKRPRSNGTGASVKAEKILPTKQG